MCCLRHLQSAKTTNAADADAAIVVVAAAAATIVAAVAAAATIVAAAAATAATIVVIAAAAATIVVAAAAAAIVAVSAAAAAAVQPHRNTHCFSFSSAYLIIEMFNQNHKSNENPIKAKPNQKTI